MPNAPRARRRVAIYHHPHSLALASRLALDLLGEGIAARPVPLALSIPTADDWASGLIDLDGVVLVYDGYAHFSEIMLQVLRTFAEARPVVFVRTGTTKWTPEIDGKIRALTLSNKWDDRAPMRRVIGGLDQQIFSRYQPLTRERGGFVDLARLLGSGSRPRDRRRHGWAFVSYASDDVLFVSQHVVPALAACEVGIFDYRYSKVLDERKLKPELEKRLRRAKVMVAYASSNWSGGENTSFEHELAGELGLPIVGVLGPGDKEESNPGMVCCRFTGDSKLDARALWDAFAVALPGFPKSNNRSRR